MTVVALALNGGQQGEFGNVYIYTSIYDRFIYIYEYIIYMCPPAMDGTRGLGDTPVIKKKKGRCARSRSLPGRIIFIMIIVMFCFFHVILYSYEL